MAYTGDTIYTAGATVSIQFSATGGTPPYTWDFSPETVVPAGLTLDGAGLVSGAVDSGAYPITVIASDSEGPVGTDSLVIYVGMTPLTLPDTLPAMCVPAPYSYSIPVSDGTGPYTFSLFEGTLPTGLTLGADGLLEGTPTVPGTYTFTVHVVDSTGV